MGTFEGISSIYSPYGEPGKLAGFIFRWGLLGVGRSGSSRHGAGRATGLQQSQEKVNFWLQFSVVSGGILGDVLGRGLDPFSR